MKFNSKKTQSCTSTQERGSTKTLALTEKGQKVDNFTYIGSNRRLLTFKYISLDTLLKPKQTSITKDHFGMIKIYKKIIDKKYENT